MSTKEFYEKIVAFRDAAVKDGWSIKPTYKLEEVDEASTLQRDGFRMSILTRMASPGDLYRRPSFDVCIGIWGPDGLAIRVPPVYNFESIKEGLRICNNCKKTNVKTERYSFAGRCCKKCLPQMKKEHEGPGWCD
jgi:hypothetical protein